MRTISLVLVGLKGRGSGIRDRLGDVLWLDVNVCARCLKAKRRHCPSEFRPVSQQEQSDRMNSGLWHRLGWRQPPANCCSLLERSTKTRDRTLAQKPEEAAAIAAAHPNDLEFIWCNEQEVAFAGWPSTSLCKMERC